MLVTDQFMFAPAFIAVFMSSVSALEGKMDQIGGEVYVLLSIVFDSLIGSTDVLKGGWWGAVQTNWMMWIPAQLINFALVPLQVHKTPLRRWLNIHLPSFFR
jgi:peroxisomal membrane protein 2